MLFFLLAMLKFIEYIILIIGKDMENWTHWCVTVVENHLPTYMTNIKNSYVIICEKSPRQERGKAKISSDGGYLANVNRVYV